MTMRKIGLLFILLLMLPGSYAKAEEIIGKWTATSPDGERISYEFKADNSVVWSVDSPSGSGSFTARYSVDYSTKPIQLNIFEFNAEPLKEFQFVAIIEFISPKKMRLNGIQYSMRRPKPRPKDFKQAIEFTKVD